MNPNPTSPLSGKPLSECDDAEVNAWIAVHRPPLWPADPTDYTHDGNAALSLMQSDVWPITYSLGKHYDDYAVYDERDGAYVSMCATPAQAIARAWLVARKRRRRKDE